MAPAIAAAAAAAFLKGIGALFGSKGRKKKEQAQRQATVSALTTRQKQQEDRRRSNVRLGSSLLNTVPETTAGGGIRTNVGIDPAVVADLEKERTYDFESMVPQAGAGSTYDFLSGLFGGAGDVAVRAFGGPAAAPAAVSGMIPSGAPSSPMTPPGGLTRTPWDVNAGQPHALSIEDLLALSRGDKGPY